jgi:hypothetical protein
MQKPVPSKRHRTIPEIRQLLARFLRSGLSQLHFARNEGVCLSVARHDNRGGFRKDNLRDLAPIFLTLSGNFKIPGAFASFFRCHAGPSH